MPRFVFVALFSCLAFSASVNAQAQFSLPWQRNFTPLEQTLAYVYTHHPRINAERDELRIADEQVAQAVAGFRPRVTVDSGVGRQRQKVENQDWQYGAATSASISAVQPLFNGFGTVAAERAAKARVMAARAKLMAVEQSVLLTVIGDWLEICEKERMVALTQDNLYRMYQYADATRERFNAGDSTQTDVAQANSRLAQAEARLATVTAERDVARATFERHTGLIAPAVDYPGFPALLPASRDEAERIANGNPDLLQAQYEQRAAEQDIEAAESRLWPEVYLRGSMSEERSAVLGLDRLRNDAVTINARLPLYQGGAEYSRVREAKLMRDKTRHDALDIGRGVLERVRDAWHHYMAAQSVISATQRASEASHTALGGVLEEQRQGLRTLTDVLDEQSQLLSVQLAEAEAQKNVRLEAYRLLAALGKLTASDLGLPVHLYDPARHYNQTASRWAGLEPASSHYAAD